MNKVINYSQGETIATGFVRPKVTALFFDKLWLPESLINTTFDYLGIPDSVVVKEEHEITIRPAGGKKFGDIYSIARVQNSRRSLDDIFIADEYKLGGMSNVPPKYDFYDQKFLYSKHRNRVILYGYECFRKKYGISISPVFHDITEFEKNLIEMSDRQRQRSIMSAIMPKKAQLLSNNDVLSICIQDFPLINEEELSWEHIEDIRNDKTRASQLRRFVSWANTISSGLTPNEIRESLNKELDSYKEVLHELGVKTAIGTFSTLVSSATSIAMMSADPKFAILSMAGITVESVKFFVDLHYGVLKERKNPIAYLYNVTQE